MPDFNDGLFSLCHPEAQKAEGSRRIMGFFGTSCLRMTESGVTVVAALIAIFLMGALGAGIAYFTASNQQTRIQQVTSDQAFYSAHAGIEFALGQILTGGSSALTFTRHFSGETISITRASGLITVSTAEKSAVATHSITDPNPTSQGTCLQVDTSAKAISGNNLLVGLVLSRDASCATPLVITGMQISWVPDGGEQVNRIRIAENPVEYGGPSQSSGSTFDFGSNDYTINDSGNHDLTDIRWTSNVTNHNFTLVFLMEDSSTKTVAVNFLASNQASCFSWNTASARLTNTSSLWRDLTETTVQNTCSDPIRLDKMTVSWTPTSPSRNLEQVRIDGSNIYDSSAASGVQIDVDQIISASTSLTVDRFRLDDEMLGRNYTVIWQWADGTTNSTTLNLFNSNEHDCLTISASNSSIDPSDNTRIIGLTLENTCAADIGMTNLTLSWSGESGRRLTQSVIVDVDGSNTYNSNAASGSVVDFGDNDLYLINGIGPQNITRLEFNDDVTPGLAFTLQFAMADGNTKSATFTPNAQANPLSIDISAANIAGSGDIDLVGITLTNTGGSTITWDRVIVTWSPTTGGRRLQRIDVAGSTVWTGNASSGSNQNITDVILTAGQTKSIDFFRFNGDMSARTFTIQFVMGDGTSKTTASFTPPDG
jgi:Flp pilus assembly protein TadG